MDAGFKKRLYVVLSICGKNNVLSSSSGRASSRQSSEREATCDRLLRGPEWRGVSLFYVTFPRSPRRGGNNSPWTRAFGLLQIFKFSYLLGFYRCTWGHSAPSSQTQPRLASTPRRLLPRWLPGWCVAVSCGHRDNRATGRKTLLKNRTGGTAIAFYFLCLPLLYHVRILPRMDYFTTPREGGKT